MLNLDVEEGGMKTMNSENQQKNVPGKIEIISQFGHKQQNIFFTHCKHTQYTERHCGPKTHPCRKQNRFPLLARSNKSKNTDEQKQRTFHRQYQDRTDMEQ